MYPESDHSHHLPCYPSRHPGPSPAGCSSRLPASTLIHLEFPIFLVPRVILLNMSELYHISVRTSAPCFTPSKGQQPARSYVSWPLIVSSALLPSSSLLHPPPHILSRFLAIPWTHPTGSWLRTSVSAVYSVQRAPPSPTYSHDSLFLGLCSTVTLPVSPSLPTWVSSRALRLLSC